MAQFLQQYWLWVILIGVMFATHLRGHRRGGQSGQGATHAGCGGHAAHGTPGREKHRDHRPATPEQSAAEVSGPAARQPSVRDSL